MDLQYHNQGSMPGDDNSRIDVVEFVIMSAPIMSAQYARPYEFHADSEKLHNLADAVDSSIQHGTSISAHINQAGWLGTSAAPTNSLSIDGGWDVKRGSFRLVLDMRLPIGVYRYEIQGYTNYLDTSMSGHIDTSMRLYIDHVTSFMIRGNNATVNSVNYVHSSGNNETNNGMPLPGDGGHMARVADINTSISFEQDYVDANDRGWGGPQNDIIDTRNTISGNNVQLSSTSDLILSHYVNTLVGAWIEEGTKSSLDPWGSDNAFEDSNKILIPNRIEMIDGIKATGATLTSGKSNSITLEDLTRNLSIAPQQITLVDAPVPDAVDSMFSGISTPMGVMPGKYVSSQYSQDWVNSDLVTGIAHTLGTQLETAVIRYGIVSLEVGGYIVSPMEDDRDVVLSNAVPATAYINVGIAINSLRNYIASAILLPVSSGGTIALQFSATICTYGETRINISISDGENINGPYSYTLPSYAAGISSSVVMPDNDTYSTAITQARYMKDTVLDVVNSNNGLDSPIHNI